MIAVAKITASKTPVTQVIPVFRVILAHKRIYNVVHHSYLLRVNHVNIFLPHGRGDDNNVDIATLAPLTYLVKILHVVIYP